MIIKECLLKRRWIVLAITMALMTVAISCYLIYREVYKPEPPNEILEKYFYLFQPVSEMETDKNIPREDSQVPETENPFNDTCTVTCADNPRKYYFDGNATTGPAGSRNDPSAAALRDEEWDDNQKKTYHGCCISYKKFITPDWLQNERKESRRVVQFPRQKQYFLVDVCKHARQCQRGCDCRQEVISARALVAEEDGVNSDGDTKFKNARIEWVEFPGWCKCFNN